MPYELIVSEKPSAAKRIAAALADGKPLTKKSGKVPYYELTRGNQDIVVGCAAGHLFGVAEKEKSFEYPKFDLEWKQSADIDKSSKYTKQYAKLLKKLAKDADKFTVATDYDIEGEVIGLNVIRFLANQEDARRMKFSTLTKGDLTEAYDNLHESLDWGQANSGETRHFLDWMYGINLSRALMTAIKKAGSFKVLSIGRVQGPALKIVVDKEKDIEAFEPEPYWQIKALAERDGKEFEAWHTEGRFWKKEEADEAFSNINDSDSGQVTELEKKQYKHPAPNPFNLGDLQSEAYSAFGMNPKRTLSAAQNLYTAGYLSYPRTGSQKLTPKIGYEKIISQLGDNKEYSKEAKMILDMKKLSPNNGKKKDPAHPAIYPTGVKPKGLKGDDKKVYDLVVRRFLASFGEWATREKVSLKLDVNGEEFKAGGKRTIKPGWHVIYKPYLRMKETELPDMGEGDGVGIEEVELLDKETEPPRRYTQAGLVKELEKRDLGTKATRADIVDSLYNRGYVKEKSMVATRMGIKTVETLEKYCPEILDEDLTRHFEKEMEKIRSGNMKMDEVLEESKKVLVKMIKNFDENIEKIGEDLKGAHHETLKNQSYLGPCPECEEGTMRIRKGKYGRFAACDKYPDCKTTKPLPKSGAIKSADKTSETGWPMIKIFKKGKRPQEISINPEDNMSDKVKKFVEKVENGEIEVKDPETGSKMVVRTGPYGKFFGSEDYPKNKTIINPDDVVEDYEDQL